MKKNLLAGLIVVFFILILGFALYFFSVKEQGALNNRNLENSEAMNTPAKKKNITGNTAKKIGIWPDEADGKINFGPNMESYYIWTDPRSTDPWQTDPSHTITEQAPFINGVKSPYSDVKNFVFSPTGKKIAYIAKTEGQEFAVVAGEESKKYDQVFDLFFTADDNPIFIAVKENQTFVVKNGLESPIPYVRESGWSENGHIFHRMYDKTNKRYTILLDGNEIDKQRQVSIAKTTEDEQHLLYGDSSKGEQNYFVFDGKEYTYAKIGNLSLHESGKFAATVEKTENGKQFLVLNGQQQPDINCDNIYSLQFSKKGDIFFICENDFPGLADKDKWPKFSNRPSKLKQYVFYFNGQPIHTASDTLNKDQSSWEEIDFNTGYTVFDNSNSGVGFSYLRETWDKGSFKSPTSSKTLIAGTKQRTYEIDGDDAFPVGFGASGSLIYATTKHDDMDTVVGYNLFFDGQPAPEWQNYYLADKPIITDDGKVFALAHTFNSMSDCLVVDGKIVKSLDDLIFQSISLDGNKLLWATKSNGDIFKNVEVLN